MQPGETPAALKRWFEQLGFTNLYANTAALHHKLPAGTVITVHDGVVSIT